MMMMQNFQDLCHQMVIRTLLKVEQTFFSDKTKREFFFLLFALFYTTAKKKPNPDFNHCNLM